ncbi:uncharacterized protein LOC144549187 [Carex rostrata]
MKILVVDETAKVFSLECESSDTIAHLKAKWKTITTRLMFDGKELGDNFSDNKTLADVGIQDGSLILESWTYEHNSCGEPRRPEKDYLYYADAFKSGWREEHAIALLHLLLELCKDGTISEGNVTDEAWLRIQNSLNNSMKCSFEIDFLKDRLRDYKNLYTVLAETTSSSFFEWDHKRKIITMYYSSKWKQEYPELLLLCRSRMPYFDTLKEVCLLVNTTPSSEQRVSETSTNIDNAREASSSRGEICIQLPSDSNLGLMVCSTSIGKENGSTMEILVVDETANVFPLKCESTDTIAHLKARLKKITQISFFDDGLMFDGKELGDEFSENMTLADVGIQDGSLILILCCDTIVSQSAGLIERPRRRPEKDYLHYADAFKSGWREEHAKALLHLLLKLCQDGTISERNVTDEAWRRIQNSLKHSMKCSFQIDFLKERLCDYKQLYSVLADTTTTSIFRWDRERKTITITSNWRVGDWRDVCIIHSL